MGRVKQPISPEGMAEAEAELQRRREVERPRIVAEIKTAREFGDLSENAEYHAAREAQGLNEARIRVLEHHLAGAEAREAAGNGLVAVGSRVRIRDCADDTVTEVSLVHPLEVNVAAGRISTASPVAKALIGARAGDEVTLDTPRGLKRLEILEIVNVRQAR
ncbi:MAG: transcription elongation factor GreA [Solirubrobacterales bacterium]